MPSKSMKDMCHSVTWILLHIQSLTKKITCIKHNVLKHYNNILYLLPSFYVEVNFYVKTFNIANLGDIKIWGFPTAR